MYLAILMLAGQGIPEGTLGAATQVAVAVTALFSVAIFAIPAAMLAWGFEAEAERLSRKKRRMRKKKEECQKLGIPYVQEPDSDESESDSDDDKDKGEEKENENENEKEKDDTKVHKKTDSRSATCPVCHGLGYVMQK